MKKGCRIGIIFSVPILAVLLIKYVVPAYQRFTTGKLLPCIYYATTGYLCPGCGVTRSIYALAKGNILLSLRNNPIVLLIILFLILAIPGPAAIILYSLPAIVTLLIISSVSLLG